MAFHRPVEEGNTGSGEDLAEIARGHYRWCAGCRNRRIRESCSRQRSGWGIGNRCSHFGVRLSEKWGQLSGFFYALEISGRQGPQQLQLEIAIKLVTRWLHDRGGDTTHMVP